MEERSRIILEVKNLSVDYREKDIFKSLKYGKLKRGIKDITFSVEKGEVFSIIGLNGAGKTSTMKCILGLIDQDNGSVEVFGKGKLGSKGFERIGYLPEISYYPKTMRLKDVMMYYAELYNMPKKKAKERIESTLEELGIADRINDKLEGFSKGMLQKVGLAQAIINDPEILFLDEPMSGLDPLARAKVVELIEAMKARGTTVFFNTHILADVANIGDRIAIIHEGQLLEIIDMKGIRDSKEFDVQVARDNKVIHYTFSKEELNEGLESLIHGGASIKKVEEKQFDLRGYFIESIGRGDKGE